MTIAFRLNTFLALLVFALPAHAQEYIADVQQFGVAEGLSHREVGAILQDSRGFMWFGTPFGLNRFDGREFRWWTKEKNGLPNNDISGLLEDAAGDLWVSSDYGGHGLQDGLQALCFLNIYSGRVRSVAEKFGSELPVPLGELDKYGYSDTSKTIYFGTVQHAKVISWHPKAGFRVLPLPGYESFRIVGISPNHSIWGIADKKVCLELSRQGKILQVHRDSFYLNGKKFFLKGQELIYESSGAPGAALQFWSIDQEKRRRLLDASKELHFPVDSLNRIIRTFFLNPLTQNLWVFSKNYLPITHSEKGLLLNFYEQYPELIQDANIGIRSIAADAGGRVWWGGNYGVYKIKIQKNKFRRFLYQAEDKQNRTRISGQVLAKKGCRSIVQQGNFLYVSTERYGLQVFDLSGPEPNRAVRQVQVVPPPSLNKAYALLHDKDNKLWIGEHQLHQYDPVSGEIRLIENQQPVEDPSVIWTMYEDGKNDIWLGQGIGLQRMDRTKDQVVPFSDYNSFYELSKAPISYIGEDRQGTIWICAATGLYTLDIDKGITARYWSGGKSAFHLPQDKFQHLYQDTAGIYWLATAGGGLIRWNKAEATFQQFTRVDGLPNNNIYAVYEDRRQQLWMSSDYGIIQFDKQSHQIKSYLTQDGITHHEFNRTSHFQSSDGRIWFGGLNGVTSFQPEDFYGAETGRHAPLQITRFYQFDGAANRLLDKTGDLLHTKQIVLHPSDRFFQLEFALLSFEDVDQVRYAYKIEGVDEDWSYQRANSIRISSLPYGNYVLKIRGQAADGLWSENTLEIAVQALRPVYLQGWFLFLLGVFLLGLAFALYKWRSSQYKKQQRRLEQEVARQTATIRKQAEALHALDQAKSRFFANISHEFRTPLTVIKGLAAEIKEDQQAQILINRNADNLLRLINQLLDLSKLESGTLSLNLVQANIVHYLQYLTESFYSMAEEKKIRLTFYSEIPELVMDFDEEKIQYIVYNLLSNAIKFTPADSGGKVIFHAQHIQTDGGEALQLKIQDTGIGMSVEEQAHIFERFYQAPPASMPGESASKSSILGSNSTGTGIGLTLSKELIELMGGDITLESGPGQGSQFTILLPISQKAPLAEQPGDAIPAGQQPPKATVEGPTTANESEQPLLLLIEDNRDVVAYIERLLQQDYKIETSFNGAAGIEKALEIVPDIIISDVMMPQKTGYEVCETLKNDERTSHIPIILLTAKAADTDKIEGLKSGADAYLMKPFNKEELFVRLEKLLELRRSLQKRYGDVQSPVSKTGTSSDDRFIQNIRQTIEEHISDSGLGIAQLSAAVHLGHTQVFRKLKALTGQNPTIFIRNVRLQKAMELLHNTDRSISDIAYDLGFSDPNYFSRVFSEAFGASPSAVRKR